MTYYYSIVYPMVLIGFESQFGRCLCVLCTYLSCFCYER